jgi:4-pyridoxate dehydrogenase
VVGGSSSINAMAYVRGHRGDYDRWAVSGLTAWSYADVLPYFRRQESWEEGANDYRGSDGPLTTQFNRYADPLGDAFLDAGLSAGHSFTPDYNGGQQEGFGRLQSTVRNGRRCSTAVAYLRPALGRPNLKLEVKALATRILFEGMRAVGIEWVQGGTKRTAYAAREVILSGGVINTPQLLMLSGVGDADELRSIGIKVKLSLKGVGKNLQDHMSCPATYQRAEPGPLHRSMRIDRIVGELANAYFRGKGIATDLPAGAMAFLRSQYSNELPDVQLIFISAPMTAAPYLAPFKKSYEDGFAIRAALLRPQSRGHVRLKSADPLKAPAIIQNFLATERDWQILRAGIRMAEEVGHQGAAPLCWEKTRAAGANRCGSECVHHADRHHRSSPAGDVQDGCADRRLGRGRQQSERLRDQATACGRCIGDAGSHRRQHQRAGDHDCGEGRRYGPRFLSSAPRLHRSVGFWAVNKRSVRPNSKASPH